MDRHLMMFSISVTMSFSISISMPVSIVRLIMGVANLSGGFVWNILAYLFCYWVALFNLNCEWNLGCDWVTDLSWFIMTSRWSSNNFGSVNTVGFWYWYTFWYFNSSWYLDCNLSALTLGLNMTSWSNGDWSCGYGYWSCSNERSGTKTREKEGFSISIFSIGLGISFRLCFSIALCNNMGTSNSKSSWCRKSSSTKTKLTLSCKKSRV